jgi:hypothetical protein
MRRSEAEELMRLWSDKDRKIFKYPRPLFPNEYVVFQRDGENFPCDRKKSTYTLPDMPRDGIVGLMINEEIIYIRDFTTWGPTPISLKTNNCNCGCWIIKDSDYMHDEKCPCFRRK